MDSDFEKLVMAVATICDGIKRLEAAVQLSGYADQGYLDEATKRRKQAQLLLDAIASPAGRS